MKEEQLCCAVPRSSLVVAMADAANAQPAVLEPLAPLTDRSNPGYLSGAEVHEIRLSFMPVNAFGKLLRFRDDRLEAAFWVSMRQWLSGIDKVATVLSWINSVVLVALFVQLTVVKGISSSFVVACVFYMSEVAILQAVVLLRVMFRAESHFRHRDATILSVRALQCMFIVGCCLAAMHGGHFNDGAIAAYVLDIKPSATVVLINMLMHRGVLFWAQFATFFLPLRFSQHAPFHTLGVLPLLLHAAFCLARDMLAQPALKQAVCALASFLTFSTQGPGRCHPLAPQIVAYSVSRDA